MSEQVGGIVEIRTLDQHFEDFAFVVDGPPQVHLPATDPDNPFTEMPPAGRR